jgi:ferredoxin--NADP+ reductase
MVGKHGESLPGGRTARLAGGGSIRSFWHAVPEQWVQMSGFIEGKITARRDWAPGLATITVDAELERFAPGQFVNLGLELGGELVRRAYSLASAPGAPPEFFLNEVDGGVFTPALFSRRVGDAIWVEPKAQGFFTLEWLPVARDLWLIATGTGLAPYVSMLRTGQVFERFEHVVVVHGVRQKGQLAYADELDAIAAQHPGQLFRIGAVSREPEAAGVLHGRITALVASGELEARAGLELAPDRSHVMLCGNPDMIRELTDGLKARGLARHRTRKPGHITSERFWEEG